MTAGDWRPTASRQALARRAELLAATRRFFARRSVLEVETPLLAAATLPDPHIASFASRYTGPGSGEGKTLYLQTSPEFHMKRLLAAGSGPIYQLCRAFRDAEAGRRHNPEFTMLEWYRPGWDHRALMGEVEELATELLGTPPAEWLTFAEAFGRHLGLDPHRAPTAELRRAAEAAELGPAPELERDELVDLLLAAVEPRLGRGRPTFVHDFPAERAALARVRPGDPPLAERFELFIEGVELANGFHELTDSAEQRRRFEDDLARRQRAGLPSVPLPERLLAALAAGLPDCAGVALGFDRLVMIATGAERLAEVIAFPVDRA